MLYIKQGHGERGIRLAAVLMTELQAAVAEPYRALVEQWSSLRLYEHLIVSCGRGLPEYQQMEAEIMAEVTPCRLTHPPTHPHSAARPL